MLKKICYLDLCHFFLSFFSFIKWNFTKFLIDKNGVPVKRYAPNVEPLVCIYSIWPNKPTVGKTIQ